MSLLLYGIIEAGGPPEPRLAGDAGGLLTIVEGPLAAIVTEHRGSPPEPSLERLCDHERTVRTLMDSRAILPARFGSVLADERTVRALLRRRRRDLLARLRRVRDAVELALRANWRDRAGTPPAAQGAQGRKSGTSYLRERLEHRRSARRLASELDPLTALARSSRRRLTPAPDLPVLDAYLVERGRVGEFVDMVRQLDDRLEDVELTCTGPWPPYSFAEGAPV
jgi:hypothetical protein